MESNDSHDRIGSGEKPDNDGRKINDWIYWPNVIRGRRTANIFENIESMTLNDIMKDHHQDGKTNPNCKINQDCTTFIGFGRRDHANACNMVETTVDAKRRGWNRDRDSNDKLARNVAPNRRPVDRVTSPHNRVDEQVKTS